MLHMVKLNIKSGIKLSLLMIFLIMIVFSISSVSAADDAGNETVIDDNSNNNNSINYNGTSSSTNSSFSNISTSSLVDGNVDVGKTIVEVSLKSSDNGNAYADVSVGYDDYYVSVNNKDYPSFFKMNSGFKKASYDNSKNILDIIAFAKNNRLMMNLNLLNVSSQEVELSFIDDLTWNLINFIRSLFN